MEEVFDLPTKRANVEIGSGSGSGEEGEEARKKAKLDFVYDFSKFTIDIDFVEHYKRISPRNPIHAWREYENSLREKFRLREIQLFLESKGREAEAMEIHSLSDQRARKIIGSFDFKGKGWILRPNPGPYTEYQRLYVDDYTYNMDTGEVEAKYCDLFCTHASDDAFLKLFEELQSLLRWDMSYQDAEKIVLPTSKRYPHLQVDTLSYAITEIIYLKQVEETQKELVPFFAKLWQETVKKERDVADVLVHIKDNDAALYPLLVTAIDNKRKRRYYLKLFEDLKSGTKVAPRDEDLEEHIDNFFYPVGRIIPIKNTYASYVKEKMKVAAYLGLE